MKRGPVTVSATSTENPGGLSAGLTQLSSTSNARPISPPGMRSARCPGVTDRTMPSLPLLAPLPAKASCRLSGSASGGAAPAMLASRVASRVIRSLVSRASTPVSNVPLPVSTTPCSRPARVELPACMASSCCTCGSRSAASATSGTSTWVMTTTGSAAGSSVPFVRVRSETETGSRPIDRSAARVPAPSATTRPAAARGGPAAGPTAISTTGANVSGPIVTASAGPTCAETVRLRSPVMSSSASRLIDAPLIPGKSAVTLASTLSTGGLPPRRSSTHCAP